jgi:hypothetical protein
LPKLTRVFGFDICLGWIYSWFGGKYLMAIEEFKKSMANDFFTHDDLKLFELLRNEIKSHPDQYLEAGEWLNHYYSEEKFWEGKKELLNEYIESYNSFDNTSTIARDISERIEWLRQICKSRNYISWEEFQEEISDLPASGVPVIYRLLEAKDALYQKLSYNYSIISKHDAMCIYLLTWVLTDPEPKNDIDISITEFQKYNIDELDGHVYSRMSLVFPLHDEAVKWINAVKIAKQKLEAENKNKDVKERQKGSIFVENLNARHVSLGDKAQHAGRDKNKNTSKTEKEWPRWIFIFAAFAGILSFLFGPGIYYRLKSLKSSPIVGRIISPSNGDVVSNKPKLATGQIISPLNEDRVPPGIDYRIELLNPDETKFYYIAIRIRGLYWPKVRINLRNNVTAYTGTTSEGSIPPDGRFSLVLFEVNAAMHERISTWLNGTDFRGITIDGRELACVDVVLQR